MQRLSTVGHGQSFFIFRLLFHMSARQAQLSKGTKSVTVVGFFNPRSMKLPATFQPLFTGGEFSDVLWHTERGMSRIYLHSHPFQLGTLNFWGDFRWVWICGGIVLLSLKVYFAECLGLLMKQPTVSFPISMGSNDFHMIPGHSANFNCHNSGLLKSNNRRVGTSQGSSNRVVKVDDWNRTDKETTFRQKMVTVSTELPNNWFAWAWYSWNL